jgi:DNA-binding LacI/PurR family transcriptional regulator
MATHIIKPVPDGNKAVDASRMLERMARHVGAGNKLPTVRDLCKTMRISRYTMDTALNDLEAQGLLYRKHGSGLYVTSLVQTRRIALVIRRDIIESSKGSADSTHLIIDGLRAEGARRNTMLTCYSYDPNHDKEKFGLQPIEWDVQNGRVDGIIIGGLTFDQGKPLQALGLPCVVFSGDVGHFVAQVRYDFPAMISKGVQAIFQAGRRRVGLAYPVRADNSAFSDSLELFHQALREMGVEEDSRWLMPFSANDVRIRALEASRQFHRLWERSDRPDALLSLDDQFAAGLLHAAEVLRVNIPTDLLVVSHANKGLNLFDNHPVIRIEYDMEEIARRLLGALDDLFAGRNMAPIQSVPPQVIWPEPDLTSATCRFNVLVE